MGFLNTSSLFLILLLVALFFPLNCYSQGIKGMLVFGSSLTDNGNNLFLPLNGTGNYLPYGVDLPNGPSGRYTNGKTVNDCFGDNLKLPLIPPFYDPTATGPKIVNGVDFGVGGAGILDNTGADSGVKDYNLNKQINNFVQTTLPALEAQLGTKPAEFLGNYMFFFGIGGNDIRNNYFAHPSGTIEAFTDNLIQLFSGHIKNLYSLGGKKFVIIGTYPLGCVPLERDAQTSTCNQTMNNAIILFNSKLKTMVDTLSAQMPGSNLVFVNAYKIINDLMTINPAAQGIKDVANPCCDILQYNGKKYSPCAQAGKVCPDRKANIWFDGVHTTEVVNSLIASKAFTSTLQTEVYPINVAKLSMI